MPKFLAKNLVKLSLLGLIVAVAKADVIFPLTFVFIPYSPLVIAPELATFYFLGRRLGVDANVKAFVTVVATNILSSFLGLFLFVPTKSVVAWFLVAFLFSVAVEGALYFLVFKLGVRRVAILSALLNLSSYVVIAVFFAFKLNRHLS